MSKGWKSQWKMTELDTSIAIARAAYEAYGKKDRAAIDKLIAADPLHQFSR